MPGRDGRVAHSYDEAALGRDGRLTAGGNLFAYTIFPPALHSISVLLIIYSISFPYLHFSQFGFNYANIASLNAQLLRFT